jgi:[ribosomal protein S18]-alanine N-acetyltransferase
VSSTITPLPATAAEPLALLHAACFPEEPWGATALRRIMALSGGFARLASHGERPVGFVLARDLGDECEILSLGVIPEYRRLGVGRALLGAVIEEAARLRRPSVVLEVAADNTAARRLYEEAGFIAVGHRPRYYRRGGDMIDALILRCPATGKPSPT